MFIYLFELVLLYAISYGFYYFTYLKKSKKNPNKKMDFAEAKIFIKLYNVDLKKVSYDKLCNTICLFISFNLTITVFFGYNIDTNIFFKILIGIAILSISTILTYRLLGIYYKKHDLLKK